MGNQCSLPSYHKPQDHLPTPQPPITHFGIYFRDVTNPDQPIMVNHYPELVAFSENLPIMTSIAVVRQFLAERHPGYEEVTPPQLKGPLPHTTPRSSSDNYMVIGKEFYCFDVRPKGAPVMSQRAEMKSNLPEKVNVQILNKGNRQTAPRNNGDDVIECIDFGKPYPTEIQKREVREIGQPVMNQDSAEKIRRETDPAEKIHVESDDYYYSSPMRKRIDVPKRGSSNWVDAEQDVEIAGESTVHYGHN